MCNITNEQIDKVLSSFIGQYNMQVPMYSAIKINGKKLYEYARNNEKVDIPIRKVYIYDLKRISDLKDNKFKIKCTVSKGTYIRSLIRDISKKLNTIGVMSDLIRTKQGDFELKDCYKIEDIEKGNYKILGLEKILKLPKIEISDDIYKKVINGNKIDNIYNQDKFMFVKNNKLIAVYHVTDDKKY